MAWTLQEPVSSDLSLARVDSSLTKSVDLKSWPGHPVGFSAPAAIPDPPPTQMYQQTRAIGAHLRSGDPDGQSWFLGRKVKAQLRQGVVGTKRKLGDAVLCQPLGPPTTQKITAGDRPSRPTAIGLAKELVGSWIGSEYRSIGPDNDDSEGHLADHLARDLSVALPGWRSEGPRSRSIPQKGLRKRHIDFIPAGHLTSGCCFLPKFPP